MESFQSVELEELLPYQEVGAQFLASRKQAMLADIMGLGKTAQAIAACDKVGATSVLVVCPSIAKYNWQREFARFSFLDRNARIIEKKTDRPAAGLTIISFDMASDDKMKKALIAVGYDALIIDEAHFIKSRTAKRTKAIYGVKCDGKTGIAASCRHVWRLTGTPIPNYPNELWAHLKSAGAYEFDYYAFERTFCAGYDTDYGFKVTGGRNTEALKKLLEGFMLRRVDKGDLPPITYQTITLPHIELTDEDYLTHFTGVIFTGDKGKLIQEITRQARVLADGFDNIARNRNLPRFAKIGKGEPSIPEKQLELLKAMSDSTASLRKYVGLIKCKSAIPMLLEELESGAIDKLVVFAYHHAVIKELEIGFSDMHPAVVHGGTVAKKRDRLIRNFENGNGGCRVFIGQILAAGTAITLTSACEIAMMEMDYVPGNNAQAVMRVHRISQDRPVRVRMFTVADSIDESITKILRAKMQSQLQILG